MKGDRGNLRHAQMSYQAAVDLKSFPFLRPLFHQINIACDFSIRLFS